jgi:hypothetical protein
MALFAKAKEPFLRSFLKLNNGVPSHDTFSRLFRNLDPDQFRARFNSLWSSFARKARALWPLMGRFYSARLIAPAANRPCIW